MTLNSNQAFNMTNSNMNINTNVQLFNNQDDDLDVFPNFQRPSLGTNYDLSKEFNNFQAH